MIAQSSNIGIPPIQNFNKKTYKAGTQNWDIKQDDDGVMYFANNEGLLEFNGSVWQCYPIKNKTVVRSIFLSASNTIYVGGQSEMGYFKPDDTGSLKYHSLKELIPKEHQNFEDVWNIVAHENAIFFNTAKAIYKYKDDRISVFEPAGSIQFMGVAGDRLLVHENFNGLLEFKDRSYSILNIKEKLNSTITSVLDWNADEIMICTLKDGIFIYKDNQLIPWKTSNDDFLKSKRIYKAAKLDNQNLVLASSLGGIFILDKTGKILKHLDKSAGLQNANVLSVFPDQRGSIWVGLDNGIDCVANGSSFSFIYPDLKLEGTGYTSKIFEDQIYFGTSSGLYVNDWKSYYNPLESQEFELVKNTSGQVWGLNIVEEKLLLGHHEGAFQINNNKAIQISNESSWNFVSLADRLAISGNYQGLSLFEKRNNAWQFKKKFKGFDESSRIIVHGKQLWMSHPYRGLYKIQYDNENIDIKFYNSAHGLPSNLNNYVFEINGQAVFGTEEGVYKFDMTTDRFVPHKILNAQLGKDAWIKNLTSDPDGNIWFVTDAKIGILKIEDDGLQKHIEQKIFPELNEKLVGGFEYIYPYDKYNVFFGAEKGFVHYNPSKRSQDTVLQVIFDRIQLIQHKKDSLIFAGRTKTPTMPALKSEENALRFSYSATAYWGDIQYSTFLENFDQDWSTWTNKTSKEYTNLGPGNYRFHVKAKSPLNIESQDLIYEFQIKPPWYWSWWAKLAYAVVFLLLLLGWSYFQRTRFESEKEELQTVHLQKEAKAKEIVAEKEAALSKLKNEKLKSEVEYKTMQLASATMHLVQKREMFNRIEEDLNKAISKDQNITDVKKGVQKVIRLLKRDEQLDDSWEQFSFHFDQVHSNFLKRIRKIHPNLTINDHKLCAYLRMNLSTKEIANLLNISVRGVEGSRYRLRKKLALEKEVNLVDYIMGI